MFRVESDSRNGAAVRALFTIFAIHGRQGVPDGADRQNAEQARRDKQSEDAAEPQADHGCTADPSHRPCRAASTALRTVLARNGRRGQRMSPFRFSSFS